MRRTSWIDQGVVACRPWKASRTGRRPCSATISIAAAELNSVAALLAGLPARVLRQVLIRAFVFGGHDSPLSVWGLVAARPVGRMKAPAARGRGSPLTPPRHAAGRAAHSARPGHPPRPGARDPGVCVAGRSAATPHRLDELLHGAPHDVPRPVFGPRVRRSALMAGMQQGPATKDPVAGDRWVGRHGGTGLVPRGALGRHRTAPAHWDAPTPSARSRCSASSSRSRTAVVAISVGTRPARSSRRVAT